MPRTLISVLFLLALTPAAWAEPDEVLVGPTVVKQPIGGAAIATTVNAYLKAVAVGGKPVLRIRLVGDLSDFQSKIDAVIASFHLPADNCGNVSANNPVVTVSHKALEFKNGAAQFSVGGQVVDWQCLKNPVPNTRVEWQVHDVTVLGKKVGTTRVPHLVAWPGNPIKTVLFTQAFDATFPVLLVRLDDHKAALRSGKSDVRLSGRFASITKGVLNITGVNINDKVNEALGKAVDPNMLIRTLPADVLKYNPSIDSAKFTDLGGHLTAELALSAPLGGQKPSDLIQLLLNKAHLTQ